MRTVFSLLISLSLLSAHAYAEGGQPEGERGKQNPREKSVMVEPSGSSVDPVREESGSAQGGSHDGSDNPTLFRETLDFKEWLAASKLWQSLRPSQKRVSLSKTMEQVAFGAVALGGTYYLLSKSPLALRLALVVGFVSTAIIGSANADETFQYQTEIEGVNRFYYSYNTAVQAMELHRSQKAEMIQFHRELLKQMHQELGRWSDSPTSR